MARAVPLEDWLFCRGIFSQSENCFVPFQDLGKSLTLPYRALLRWLILLHKPSSSLRTHKGNSHSWLCTQLSTWSSCKASGRESGVRRGCRVTWKGSQTVTMLSGSASLRSSPRLPCGGRGNSSAAAPVLSVVPRRLHRWALLLAAMSAACSCCRGFNGTVGRKNVAEHYRLVDKELEVHGDLIPMSVRRVLFESSCRLLNYNPCELAPSGERDQRGPKRSVTHAVSDTYARSSEQTSVLCRSVPRGAVTAQGVASPGHPRQVQLLLRFAVGNMQVCVCGFITDNGF